MYVPIYNVVNDEEIDSEIRICQGKLDELSETLKREGVPSNRDPANQYSIFTLLLHLAQRLNRLKPQQVEHKSRVASLNEVVATLKESYYPSNDSLDPDVEIDAQTVETNMIEIPNTSGIPTNSPSMTSFVQIPSVPLDVNLSLGDNHLNTKNLQEHNKELHRRLDNLQKEFHRLKLQNTGAIPKTSIDRRLTVEARPFIPGVIQTNDQNTIIITRFLGIGNHHQPVSTMIYIIFRATESTIEDFQLKSGESLSVVTPTIRKVSVFWIFWRE
jgi:hypothetical protein